MSVVYRCLTCGTSNQPEARACIASGHEVMEGPTAMSAAHVPPMATGANPPTVRPAWDVVATALDTAEWGHHELTRQEAERIIAELHRHGWLVVREGAGGGW